MDGENLSKSNIPYSEFGDNTFAVHNFHVIMDRDLIPAIFGMHSYQVKELMNFKKRKSSEDNDDVDITNKRRKIHEIMINSNSSSEDFQKWFQTLDGGEVQNWLQTYKNGKFAQLYNTISNNGEVAINGDDLFSFSKSDLEDLCGKLWGKILYNTLHPNK